MKMKKLMMVAVAALATNTWAATVTTGEVLSHDPWDGKFDVPYKLANVDLTAQYKVAFEITANGRTASVTNAACRLENKVYSQTLDTKDLFGERTTDRNAKAKVSLIAVRPRVIPNDLYMVIDLVNKNADGKFPVSFCSEGPDVAPNWNTDEYKTNKIVLRKISSCKWYFCDPTTDANREGDITATVPVYSDYWVGVFEVTQAQYAKVMGSQNPSERVEKLPQTAPYWQVRGVDERTSVSQDSFMGKLSSQCVDEAGKSVLGFDLPTEAQWEIACRAGTSTKWCWGNDDLASGDYAVTTMSGMSDVVSVGGVKPNAWGFFDMHGNAAEWCRDKYSTTFVPTTAEDFFTNDDSSELRRVARGGDKNKVPNYCASSYRSGYNGNGTASSTERLGFRICRVSGN